MAVSLVARLLAAMGCVAAATPCPGGQMPTEVEALIAASLDDSEEAVAGGTSNGVGIGELYSTSSDIELGYDNDVSGYTGNQYVGLRFAQVNVPAGSYVHTAHVRFTVDAVGDCCNETFSVTAKMQLSTDAPSFGNQGSGYLAGLWSSGSTVASATYSPAVDAAVGDTATSADLSLLVQEVIDQPGWQANGAMAVLFGDATGTTEAHSREYESYDTDPAQAPKLVISYCPVPACSDGSAPTIAQVKISDTLDDVEEAVPGSTDVSLGAVGDMYATSSDIELGYDDDVYTGNQYVGLRFPGLAVPKDADIQLAMVKFWVDKAGSCCDQDFSITAKMAPLADQPSFADQETGYLHTLYTTEATTAAVTYTPPVDVDADVHEPRYSADLTAVAAEVVGQSGWASGNAVAVLFGDATGSTEEHSREYESAKSSEYAPGLVVMYCGISATNTTIANTVGSASGAPRTVAGLPAGALLLFAGLSAAHRPFW